jgi:homoserine/homoserine lactone efflux protein
MDLFLYTLISLGVIFLPGPNVLVIISTSLNHGKTRGIQTVVGTSVAMVIQLAIAAVGTKIFISTLAQGFLYLKWAGAIYLLYLGISHFKKYLQGGQTDIDLSATGSFRRGFFVSLTNPKTILFFSAFIPQFTTSVENYMQQIAVLSFIFWALSLVIDSVFAILASKVSSLVRSENLARNQDGISAILYCCAATVLITTKNA